jgi:deferrochelatase/peroxidase EfeB
MTQALVTVVCPLPPDRVADAGQMIDTLGNPANPAIGGALDVLQNDAGTHFVSLHAVRSRDGLRGYIVLELSADGTEAAAVERIANAIGEDLKAVFLMASDWASGRSLSDYLLRHRVTVGGGWFSNPGVVFSGTPDMTVGRILAEEALAARIGVLLGAQGGGMGALERLDAVRSALANEPAFGDSLRPGVAAPPDPPAGQSLTGALVVPLAVTYLWPAGLFVLVWALIAGLAAPHGHTFLYGAMHGLWHGLLVALVLVVLGAGALYGLLVRAEATDWLEERTADRATQAAMFARENRQAQNHMISVTQRKPGVVRKITSLLIFRAIGELAANYYRPGFLSDIGTIHFARWVTPPGSPDVLFFSNYDGSWESYLEDFITRAHAGLTGAWSNSIGFPRSHNLVEDGATDGERFKRYARQSMQPTRFWYSAYPDLTTIEIRANSEIRRGLSGAMTEDEATAWLALFGSTARPESKLISSEIQSLLFGGLRFMKSGTCLLYTLSPETTRARAWLAEIRTHVAFNDGRRLGAEAVITLALGAPGLARLGLPEEGLNTFPFAFLEGMATEPRARILGDLGENGPANWWWGQTQPHAALLLYGRSDAAVTALLRTLDAAASRFSATLIKAIPLEPITNDKKEAFGFVDGISQPVIRDTYKGQRNTDPLHLVAPGEFILGYPDNRGNMPPGPTLPATADSANLLPLVGQPDGFARTLVESPRDLGCNGSFLVIRQLEQDAGAFNAYCEAEAARLKTHLPPPYDVSADFIAAKLVGRWRDGSSLVRHPYESGSVSIAKAAARVAAPAAPVVPVVPAVSVVTAAPAMPAMTPTAASPAASRAAGTAAATTSPAIAHSATAHPAGHAGKPHEHGDNSFRFGTEDPEAVRCPFAAHIRRANPRESLDPGSDDQVAITNRHRIIRVGRQYMPEAGQKPGLLFMCLNGDIERQFEFLQQNWIMAPSFHGLSHERDPILGDGSNGECGFTIASREGPLRLNQVPRVIATRGGGYFFLPGKRLIEFLSTP